MKANRMEWLCLEKNWSILFDDIGAPHANQIESL